MEPTATTCPYCGVGCGVIVSPKDDGSYQVRGDKTHPANYGKLCSKGSALGETLELDDRLLYPVVNNQHTDWDSALNQVASRIQSAVAEYGSDSVAFYVSGQLLTEDYYVANKLMKGFIGSGNIDTNSRLCMSSSVAGHKRAFGSDTVPGCYSDWEDCDLLVLTGSNTAWCHPVLYQRIVQAQKKRPQLQVIVIDPRRTSTCDIASQHLALKPGTDSILFNGLFHWLSQQGYTDAEFVAQCTSGLEDAARHAAWSAPNIEAVASLCDLSIDEVFRFYSAFASNPKVVTVYSQGINQTSSGTDKVNAIINCHLLTGRIGKPAMGPFSVTGQPNAMGGREVGALSNQLAAHMDYSSPLQIDLVSRFWKAANMSQQPGLKAVDLFDAVHQGKIKVLWIMATNPAVSMPNAGFVREALQRCDTVIVSDCVAANDTLAFADIKLSALAWGEKSGTVTNSERCISRQRTFLEKPGEAKADWWILSEVARRMGFDGFDYANEHQIFIEHAALSAFENAGSRDFDLTGLTGVSEQNYQSMQPLQWPVLADGSAVRRMFADGKYFTEDRKAKFIAVTPRPPGKITDENYSLVLNTGRVRDQWHTMTRTGKSPRLNGHIGESYCEINEQDALSRSIQEDDLVRVRSELGSVVVRARISQHQQRGSVFVPMHWNNQNASQAAVDCLVNAAPDPVSGQPEFKNTPVQIERWQGRWYGFVLSRSAIDVTGIDYWVRSKKQGLWHYELAGINELDNPAEFARNLLAQDDTHGQWSELRDTAHQTYRAAQFIDGKLDQCVFIGANVKLPPRDWLIQLFGKQTLDRTDRMHVLAGIPGQGREDTGPIVCSCFSVGKNKILSAITEHGLQTPEAIGEMLEAGTNCGSCIPELRELIESVKSDDSAKETTG